MITVNSKEFIMIEEPDDTLSEDGRSQIGIRASINLRIPYGKDFITTTVTTPGLWGIEKRLRKSYAREVFREECKILKDLLTELGVAVISESRGE